MFAAFASVHALLLSVSGQMQGSSMSLCNQAVQQVLRKLRHTDNLNKPQHP
jgi:uncharacterized protein YegL